ncbi:MAG TPA: hypothetical protein VIF64_09560 [Pyrinomonadaceae bacterium]
MKVALSYDATIANLITAKFAGIEQAHDEGGRSSTQNSNLNEQIPTLYD